MHLFVRPGYRQYYFGDWYSYDSFRGGGFYAWCDWGRGYRGYDPFFSYYTVRRPRYQNTTVINWVINEHRNYDREAQWRPSRTFHETSARFDRNGNDDRFDSNRRGGRTELADNDNHHRAQLVDDLARQANRSPASNNDQRRKTSSEPPITKVNTADIDRVKRDIANDRQLQDLRRKGESERRARSTGRDNRASDNRNDRDVRTALLIPKAKASSSADNLSTRGETSSSRQNRQNNDAASRSILKSNGGIDTRTRNDSNSRIDRRTEPRNDIRPPNSNGASSTNNRSSTPDNIGRAARQ